MNQKKELNKKWVSRKKINLLLLGFFLIITFSFAHLALAAKSSTTDSSATKSSKSSAASTTTSTTITPLKLNLPDLGPTNLVNLIQRVFNILLMLASVVATGFVIFAGYKYIISGGDAEKATQAKNQILGVVIGLIIIAASWAIVSFVDNILEGKLSSISFQLTEPSSSGNGTGAGSSSGGTGGEQTEEGTNTGTGGTGTGGTGTGGTGTGGTGAKEPTPITKPDDCQYTQAQFDQCFTIDSGMFACYKNANSFLSSANNLCDTAQLTQEAQTACVSLKEIHDFLAQNFAADTTVTVCDTPVSSTFEQCLNGSSANPNTCNQKVSSYISKIRKGVVNEATPVPVEKTLTPYQQCIKNARDIYTACRQKEREICSPQRTAYETCLKGIGFILKSLCRKARQAYYDCYNNLTRQCQRAYSMQLEYCRIHYRTF